MSESPIAATPAVDAPPAAGAVAPVRKHKARIEHKVPGRIRMKIPTAKSNPDILETYRVAFSAIPGVIEVKPKPETGSIVIHYDPRLEAVFESRLHHCSAQHDVSLTAARPGDEIDDMANKIANEAEFLAQRSELAKSTVEFCKSMDRELKLLTDNTIDLKIVLAGGLAAYTFLEIGASAATPMWVTLGLFSLNHFAELHSSPHPDGPPAAEAAPKI
jgi:hypothetical protein